MTRMTDRDWIMRQAALEDNCYVSTGGLLTAVEELQQKKIGSNVMRSAFAQLVKLFRRENRMSWEQFATKLDVELGEVIAIEGNEHLSPSPRTIHKLSAMMKVPTEKLFVLSGLAQSRDVQVQEESLKFAARSQPLEELSQDEHTVLQEWVKYLCEK